MRPEEVLPFILFNMFIIGVLALDLGVFHKKDKVLTVKEATIWSIIWIVLSFVFNIALYFLADPEDVPRRNLEFLAGYLVEKALSVDNIFVFIVIFSYFGVPPKFHHRILFWGVLGALVTRSIFIALGATLISQFEWILYIFGVILIVSGWKMASSSGTQVHPERNIFVRIARRFFPVRTGFETHDFFVRVNGKFHLTTMFLVLVTVETTDVVFAVDSIPAVFAVTRDPFIVYTSNVFAILGLRALYFLLAGVMNKFHYLKYGLSMILVFVGLKMIVEPFLHIPILVSLSVICVLLTGSVLLSMWRKEDPKPQE